MSVSFKRDVHDVVTVHDRAAEAAITAASATRTGLGDPGRRDRQFGRGAAALDHRPHRRHGQLRTRTRVLVHLDRRRARRRGRGGGRLRPGRRQPVLSGRRGCRTEREADGVGIRTRSTLDASDELSHPARRRSAGRGRLHPARGDHAHVSAPPQHGERCPQPRPRRRRWSDATMDSTPSRGTWRPARTSSRRRADATRGSTPGARSAAPRRAGLRAQGAGGEHIPLVQRVRELSSPTHADHGMNLTRMPCDRGIRVDRGGISARRDARCARAPTSSSATRPRPVGAGGAVHHDRATEESRGKPAPRARR